MKIIKIEKLKIALHVSELAATPTIPTIDPIITVWPDFLIRNKNPIEISVKSIFCSTCFLAETSEVV